MKSGTVDELDRQLMHALQVNGRAPFSAIAQVLGVSDTTVARRYARLREAGAVRVVGLTDPETTGEVVWLLRLRCAPSAAVSIGEALARRADTAWVRLTSGGTEIVCLVRTRSEGPAALLLDKLPRTPRVESITAHCLLHSFYGGPLSLIAKHGPLTTDQVGMLRPPRPTHRPAAPVLGPEDQRLLAVLADDGRAGLDRLAEASGWSHTTVRRRLEELYDSGVLYFDAGADWRLFGLNTHAMMWLSVVPDQLHAAGVALAEHPETAFASATTGPTNLCATILSGTPQTLYTYLTTRVAALPAIHHIETAPIIRTLKLATASRR